MTEPPLDTPLVSAMMPARNAAGTIAAAIRSVMRQTLTSFELVIVDDGSSDDTLRIATAAAARDSRVRVISSPPLGRGHARNLCLSHCSAPFVAVCDADDISLPERFAVQVAALEGPPVADCVSSARVISFTPGGSNARAAVAPARHDDIVRSLKRGRMPILFASAMFRRSFIDAAGGFDTELHRNQDFGFFLRIYEQARFTTTNVSVILYRNQGRRIPWHLLKENNEYRRLAWLRAHGSTMTIDQFRHSLTGRLYRHTVIPLQYCWSFLRDSLRVGRSLALTETENNLLRRFRDQIYAR